MQFETATYHAPADLAPEKDVISSYHKLMNDPHLRMFQDAMPDVAVILNWQRQLVYANEQLLQMFEIDGLSAVGKRPGQLFDCIHAQETIGGCGTTESCRYCGLVNAVVESQKSGRPSVQEARITTGTSHNIKGFDFQIKASPFTFQDAKYTIVAIKDISDQKRRGILENIYFESILNTVSSLQEVIETVKLSQSDEDKFRSIEIAEEINHGLFESLVAQKSLGDAEQGVLKIVQGRYNSMQLLKELDKDFANQTIAYQKKFFLDPFSHSIYFETDINILKRILTNLIKNAFEASLPGMVVRAGARLTDRTICFWIHNQNEMNDDIKLQVFQRSFSTKGKNRGIGTYESKLLVSRYLKGEISFTSNKEGTTFQIKLPLSCD
jgi:hypothetical protein